MAASLPLLLALVAALAASLATPSHADSSEKGDSLDPKDVVYLSQRVVIKLYTRRNTDNGQVLDVTDASLLADSNFDPLLPTKVVVHGWLSGEKEHAGGPILKDALLEVSAYNVILVDWSGVDSINYIGSRLRVKSIGELVGLLVDQLVMEGGMDTNDLHLIGHSLGGHIMGYAGRSAKLGNKGRITALDPAGPLFWNNRELRLDKADAGFVEVIHTCGGYLGYFAPIGHVDFYPNGGTWIQRGCGIDPGACSHCRSYSLLLESIESPGAFIGTKCSSWNDYKAGLCAGNATAELGLGLDRRARGSFFFATNSEPPYSTTAARPATPRQLALQNSQKC